MASPQLLLVGPLRPPGGIATHMQSVRELAGHHGYSVSLVDPHESLSKLAFALACACRDRAIVHTHINGHNSKSYVLGALAAGPRSLVTVHSGLAPAFIKEHRTLVRAALGPRFSRHVHVVAVNRTIADALIAAGLNAQSVHTVPALVAHSRLAIAPPGLLAIGRSHSALLACALGDGPEYGATSLLHALARLADRAPSIGTVLFGPKSRCPEIAAQATQLGLIGRVHFLGELVHEHSLGVMKHSDVFIRPTLADGDSVSVREALALGCNVVASAVGHRPPGVLTYPAGDDAALAEQLFHSLGTAPLSFVPEEASAHALLSHYQSIRS